MGRFGTLTEAGIGTANLCQTTVRELDGDAWRKRTIDCEHRHACGFWTQREGLGDLDLIFLPSAYLTLPIPTEVRDVAVGLIADESIVSQILGYSMMPLDAVTWSRQVPRINKRDAANGVIADEIVAGRSAVAAVAHAALLAGNDPATALLDWARRDGLGIEIILDMIDCAINVCGRAMDVHEQVDPRMTRVGAVNLIERRAKGRFLAEEKRFWQVVRDRVESIIDGTATGDRDAGSSSATTARWPPSGSRSAARTRSPTFPPCSWTPRPTRPSSASSTRAGRSRSSTPTARRTCASSPSPTARSPTQLITA